MDIIALIVSMFISIYFAIGILLYIFASRAYSYRGIRLKKYPVFGYLTVVVFQGAVTFWLVYHGSSVEKILVAPWQTMLAASLLIGGYYPLTQIYQHHADKQDGVKTISYLLGYKGTFIFAAIVYSIAFGVLAYWFIATLQQIIFFVLQLFFVPVLVYFIRWAIKVWNDNAEADIKNTMKINLLASVCTNLAFIIILLLNLFE